MRHEHRCSVGGVRECNDTHRVALGAKPLLQLNVHLEPRRAAAAAVAAAARARVEQRRAHLARLGAEGGRVQAHDRDGLVAHVEAEAHGRPLAQPHLRRAGGGAR